MLQTIKTDAVLDVPPEVRLCPYCGGKLYVQFSCWTQQEDGTWAADGVDLDCCSEPELNEEDEASLERWKKWLATHAYMPYAYWLPATVAVEQWINSRYRFEMNDKL